MGLIGFSFLDRFVKSERKTQVLPHMPPEKRKFVHDVSVPLPLSSLIYNLALMDSHSWTRTHGLALINSQLAAVYRMDTQMVDQEPRRSVQLIRRIDTRVPAPLLSATLAPAQSLGRLHNLKAKAPPSSSAASVLAGPTPRRGWGASVVGGQGPGVVGPSPPQSTKPGPGTGLAHRPTPPPGTGATGTGTGVVDVPDDWEDDA